MLHVAQEADGGFSGYYDHPICADRWEWRTEDQRLAFEAMFGKQLDLCPHCVDVMLGRNDD